MPPASRFGPERDGSRWWCLSVVVVVALLVVLGGSSPPAGYDVSYPSARGPIRRTCCSGSSVSMAGWRTTQTHAWAGSCAGRETRPGRSAQGNHRYRCTSTRVTLAPHVPEWPKAGTAPVYGACNGLLTDACSYLYGVQRAAYSSRLAAAQDPPRPRPRRGGWMLRRR